MVEKEFNASGKCGVILYENWFFKWNFYSFWVKLIFKVKFNEFLS